MDTIYHSLLFVHVCAGVLSLVAFLIPAFARKGGSLHNRAGRFYVCCMWVVVGTAATLCVFNLVYGRTVLAGFLGFLTLLTAYPLWYAVTVLKYKKGSPDWVLDIRRGLNALLFLGGLGLIVWSVFLGFEGLGMLLLIFGILGLTAFGAARDGRGAAREKENWMAEHIEGMIGTGIAAYTAFFAFGGRAYFSSIFDDRVMVIPWILPSIVGTIAIRLAKKKWVREADVRSDVGDAVETTIEVPVRAVSRPPRHS